MTHPHAEVLRAIADGVPLSEFELTCRLTEGGWDNMNSGIKWVSWIHDPEQWQVRRKQSTHVVNGFTVPAPMDKEPEHRSIYYEASPKELAFFRSDMWFGKAYEQRSFKRGLFFATKESAIANAKAMLKIDPEAA